MVVMATLRAASPSKGATIGNVVDAASISAIRTGIFGTRDAGIVVGVLGTTNYCPVVPYANSGKLMTLYIVGLRHKTRSKVLTIEAEDALIAALRAKA
jgi:hypothetical protein